MLLFLTEYNSDLLLPAFVIYVFVIFHITSGLPAFCVQQTKENLGKLLISLILNMRFQLTEGNWQCVSRALLCPVSITI